MNSLPLFSDYTFPLPDLRGRKTMFQNGVRLTEFADLDSEVVRLEFIFPKAGSNNQSKFFSAAAAGGMICEGCGDLSGEEVADRLDYYGAYVEKSVDRESGSIAFYFLKKYSLQLIPLVELIIKHARYPEKQFEIYRAKQRQAWETSNQKTDTLAYKHFYKLLFPTTHPLSQFGALEDYDILTAQDVRDFYNSFYTCADCEIVLAGGYSEALTKEVESRFGQNEWGNCSDERGKDFSKTPLQPKSTQSGISDALIVHKDKAAQASIRVGGLSVRHNEADFLPLKVLVELFGGYFGSRLMCNIREEKGYTYSIGSFITTYRDCSVLTTLADVKAEKAIETFREINTEMEKLQNDLVPQGELSTLKNYLLGECLRGLDGALDLADKYSMTVRSGYSPSYFEDMQDAIRRVGAQDLRELACKYLRAETMLRVAVGDSQIIGKP